MAASWPGELLKVLLGLGDASEMSYRVEPMDKIR
jgi:hypothetical protein